jgi:hypothetical protein
MASSIFLGGIAGRPPPGFRWYSFSGSLSFSGISGSAADQNSSVISHDFFCFSLFPPVSLSEGMWLLFRDKLYVKFFFREVRGKFFKSLFP